MNKITSQMALEALKDLLEYHTREAEIKARRAIAALEADIARVVEPGLDPCRQELHNILNAKRFDKTIFPSDREFIEWVLSRARNAVYTASPAAPQEAAAPDMQSDIAYVNGLRRGYTLGINGRDDEFRSEVDAYKREITAA